MTMSAARTRPGPGGGGSASANLAEDGVGAGRNLSAASSEMGQIISWASGPDEDEFGGQEVAASWPKRKKMPRRTTGRYMGGENGSRVHMSRSSSRQHIAEVQGRWGNRNSITCARLAD